VTESTFNTDKNSKPAKHNSIETKQKSSETKLNLNLLTETWQKFECTACERTLNGQHEWQQHVSSKGHKKQVSYVKNNSLGKDKKRKQVDRPESAKSEKQDQSVMDEQPVEQQQSRTDDY
jgi:hypothetical protein